MVSKVFVGNDLGGWGVALSLSPYEISRPPVPDGDPGQALERTCDKDLLESQARSTLEFLGRLWWQGPLNLPMRDGSGGGSVFTHLSLSPSWGPGYAVRVVE